MLSLNEISYFAAETSAEAESGIGALGIDPFAILLQAGTFVIIFYLVKKYALDKISDTLAERRQTIDEGLSNAHKADQRLSQVELEAEQIIAKAQTKADKFVDQAQAESNRIIQDAEVTANLKAEKIIKDANHQIDNNRQKATKELKAEILNLVATATESIIDEKIDPDKDARLIKTALEAK